MEQVKALSYEEWKEQRRKGIGGSDAAAVVGLDPWKSPVALYLEKIGVLENEVDSEAVYWGTVLEDLVAKEFENRTGYKVHKVNKILQHPEYPFMIANIDRKITGENALLECKTTNEYNKKEWQDGKIPEKYMVQVQHYLAVTGYEKAYIAVLIGGQKFVWYHVPRDEELISSLIEAEKGFWQCVEAKIPPAIDGTKSSKMALDILFPAEEAKPERKLLGENSYTLVQRYNELKERIKELEEKKAEIENKLKAELGEYEEGEIADALITWKPITTKRFDSKRFKKEYPDLYSKFLTESKYRRFAIRGGE